MSISALAIVEALNDANAVRLALAPLLPLAMAALQGGATEIPQDQLDAAAGEAGVSIDDAKAALARAAARQDQGALI